MTKKRTNEEYITLCTLRHNNKYDYSKVNYINKNEKVCIICPIHGEFWQNANNHLRGQGCPECSKSAKPRLKTTAQFINEVKEKYGNKYDLSNVNYINSKEKVKIKCNDCGYEFEIRPNDLLSGHGCKKCHFLTWQNEYLKEDLIKRFNKIHQEKYDYSLLDDKYLNLDNSIDVICPKHDVFTTNISRHLQGNGCPQCGMENFMQSRIITINEIRERLKNISNLQYSLDNSNRLSDEILLKCKKCGFEFKRKISSLLLNNNCPQCVKNKINLQKTKSTETFINEAIGKYGEEYDYSKVHYVKSNEKVEIICKKHGSFFITPNSFLQGHGCPSCNRFCSKKEQELREFIQEILPTEEIKFNVRDVIKHNELDIYIPTLKVAIEFNGIYWHSELYVNNNYHLDKLIKCNEQNITLIQVFEDEWTDKQDIVKSRLKSILQKTDNKIYARKCEIKEVDYNDSKKFLNENHLQGNCPSLYRLGLYCNNELVALMTFGNLRKNLNQSKKEGTYELLRFCNKKFTTVVGGASKLFKHFIKQYKPNEIISYADRRWSEGNLYERLNFQCYNNSKPNYFYVINGKRFNRFSYRKDVLVQKYNCPHDMSEHKFCLQNKWYRIYDCGCFCYKWVK